MNNLTQIFRSLALVIAGVAALVCGQAAALELSDIHMPMKRDDADATLSKDYTYVVLADGSVRRTWKLDGKQVIIDFDTVSNDAILVAVVYDQPIAKKKGIEDAHTLAAGKYKENASWDAPKDRDAKNLVENTCGLHRLYVGKFVTFILQLLTLGGLGIWQIIDIVRIISGSFEDAQGRRISDW